MTSMAADTVPVPDTHPDQIGLGFAEVIALMSLAPGDAAETTAAALGLAEHRGNPLVVSAGASSLVAHGYASATPDDEIEVTGPLAAIALALGTTERILELSLLTPDSIDRIWFVEAPDIAILLQERAALTWWAMAQRADLPRAEAIAFVIRKHLGQHPQSGVSLVRHGDPSGRRLLVKGGEAPWTIGFYRPGLEEVEESPADDPALLAAITDIRGA
ncbi:hypothetical protein J2W21_002240 [Sinomonas atrocyanea]|uniref:hypothetical protein n=1 Tax=Sinomonas atrocyanea TaxID=37927 RepID=UPI00277EC728|nr:hypothetical protein [Sinomonas atrocyanea]MDP9884726.1 hypothetical protein [Sinomonas atrocyanea]